MLIDEVVVAFSERNTGPRLKWEMRTKQLAEVMCVARLPPRRRNEELNERYSGNPQPDPTEARETDERKMERKNSSARPTLP